MEIFSMEIEVPNYMEIEVCKKRKVALLLDEWNSEGKRFRRIPESYTSAEDLPFDLLFKIFSNQSLQTLLNCRCVCKIWSNIIHNPSFINSYFINSVATQQSRLLLSEFHQNSTRIRIFSARPFMGGLILSDFPIAKIENASHYQHVSCLCYGLLYLQNSHGQGPAFLFNPVGGERLVLPPSAAHVSSSFISEFCGLGFDSVSETFKLVRVYINKLSGNCTTEIYVLGTQQWQMIPAVPPCVIEKDAVSAYGDVHWKGIVGDSSGSSRLVIVSFDSKEEIFRLTQAPELPSSIEYTHLFGFKGCLAIAHISTFTSSEIHLDMY